MATKIQPINPRLSGTFGDLHDGDWFVDSDCDLCRRLDGFDKRNNAIVVTGTSAFPFYFAPDDRVVPVDIAIDIKES